MSYYSKYLKQNNFYCFSPPIMIATCIIEIACLIYVLVRYKLNRATRLIAAILLCLAAFQWAEYNVCEAAFGLSSFDWAKIGCTCITMLPPLGLHLATVLAGKPARLLVGLSYGAGIVFAAIFLFMSSAMSGQVCGGNYVILQTDSLFSNLYAIYYFFLLGAAVTYIMNTRRIIKEKARIHALSALVISYAAFIVPTILIVLIFPHTIEGVPSIMCGFAVILALVLSFFVLPWTMKIKRL